jgi:hypothetical protein
VAITNKSAQKRSTVPAYRSAATIRCSIPAATEHVTASRKCRNEQAVDYCPSVILCLEFHFKMEAPEKSYIEAATGPRPEATITSNKMTKPTESDELLRTWLR